MTGRRQAPTVENWARLVRTFYDEYAKILPGRRSAFIGDLSARLGSSTNTIRRWIAAYEYLVGRGADPEVLVTRPPPVMSVEAVARVGRIDREREASLFQGLIEGQGTILSYQAALKEAERRASVGSVKGLLDVRLSDLLSGRSLGEKQWIPASAPFGPVAIFGGGFAAVAVFRFAADHPHRSDRDFQSLVQSSVLGWLIRGELVVVCTEVELPILRGTIERARPEIRSRAEFHRCRLVLD